MKKKNNLIGITISKKAEKQIKNLLNNKFQGIKIDIKYSGCMGFKYKLNIIEKIYKNYIVFNNKNINIYVKKNKIHLIDGMEIDFVEDGLNKKFCFNNPKAKITCGCGSSFNNVTI
ncbi:HesB/IscA family protein [Candidatus Annandia pinicola]|uniref:HesB/IscA family protein n=1 Tax=Candidatus Annandia pinicola TaxID=1345117 RepID=UPI001D032B1B|nr:iron-sulfur cluster assembly accessory protein [Candidatus Annandia pinicola]UDG80382.1 Protein SufA [Candidatus Annandia pinicola]